MQNILIVFILNFLLVSLLLKENKLVQKISASILLTIGEFGFLSFLFREYMNISYSNFPGIFIKILLLPVLVLLTKNLRRSRLLSLFGNVDKLDVLLLIVLGIIVLRGFWMPVRGWDAYALYDTRGRAFADGLVQSDLAEFTKYDDKNFLYYFSYPPMTSSIHAVLYSSGFVTPMFIYPLLFSSMVIFLYLIIRSVQTPKIFKIGIFSIFILNKLILEQIYSSYTNLPMIAFQIGFVYFVIQYFSDRKLLYLILSGVFLGFSNWTRNLEPTFMAFLIFLFFSIFSNNKKSLVNKIYLFTLPALIAFLPKFIWQVYVKNSVGSLGGITPTFGSLVQRILSAFELSNLLDVMLFAYQALTPIISYVILFVVSTVMVIRLKRKIDINVLELSLAGVIFTIFLIMIAGTLYFSVTFIWWRFIPGSFLRSNLVLVPLTTILCAYASQLLKKK